MDGQRRQPGDHDYTIQRATDAAFTADLATIHPRPPSPPRRTTDTAGLVAQSTYYYRIRAENAVAYSTWSDPANATTP